MQTFAHVRDGVVAEIVKIPAKSPPLEERYHPDLLPGFVELSGPGSQSVTDGWLWDGAAFSAPPAPDPLSAPRTCSPREFRERWTMDERKAVTLAASKALEAGDATLQVFLDDLSASQMVELNHPTLLAGMDAVVAAGLLTRARADAILAA
ncbi:hypothetical protein VQH23_21125 [Pararoseomonas sp. SCSIO 73927]|uniref:hypothetical protein n=1 Tax=Pararoseomonas sp. SCSIO 73927 TaxID=3114537 RepID=UPI0030CDB15A